MDFVLNIKIQTENTSETAEFEKKEWNLVNIEHYGKSVDFEKKRYKFVARDETEEIVAVLDLMLQADVASVENLIVSLKCRKQGIGRRLIEEAEKFAQKNNCRKIWLGTGENWESVKFYKKLGYSVTGIQAKHFLEQNRLILEKFL